MAGRSTHRGAFLAAALVLVAALPLLPGVASASGGGGCGGPVTDEAGTRVQIESYCFTPTIVRVEAGDEVTFANMDAAPHTVLGANGAWGSYDVLKRGREVTYTFAEAGVFPYVCTYHAGMVGTVVVGDGAGGAIGTTTASGPVTQGTASALQAAPVTSSTRVQIDPGAWQAFALVAFALLLVALGALVVERRRHRPVA
ncbi:MAG: cupredoxin domain-containing protein [Actinomycetota bacterium]